MILWQLCAYIEYMGFIGSLRIRISNIGSEFCKTSFHMPSLLHLFRWTDLRLSAYLNNLLIYLHFAFSTFAFKSLKGLSLYTENGAFLLLAIFHCRNWYAVNPIFDGNNFDTRTKKFREIITSLMLEIYICSCFCWDGERRKKRNTTPCLPM